MGDGLAQAALYVLIVLGIVFLIGFTIVLVPSLFLIRRSRKHPLIIRIPLVVLTILLSVFGGFLAVRLLYAWNDAGERDFYAERKLFTQNMAQQYPLEIEYHPDRSFDQQFKIVFSVPVSGSYDLHVKGSAPGAIIKVDKYRVALETGTNELVFGFDDVNSMTQVYEKIDFVIVIQPEISRLKLLNTQKGIFVTNPGSVIFTEGINYFSPQYLGGSSDGCLTAFYQWVPCLADKNLHIELAK